MPILKDIPGDSGHLNDPPDVLNISFSGSVGVWHGEIDELQPDDVIGVVRHAVQQLPQVVRLQPLVVADVGLQLGHPVLEQVRLSKKLSRNKTQILSYNWPFKSAITSPR